MKNPYQQHATKYQSIDLISRIEGASPHELISLLFQGARTNISAALGSMQRNEVAKKGQHISKTIAILDGLKSGLNMEAGGEVAKNLYNLYEQLQSLLVKANAQNDQVLLNKVNEMLLQVSEAWETIDSK